MPQTIVKSLLALKPYILRNRWPIIGGLLTIIVTNTLQLKVARYAGQAGEVIAAGNATRSQITNIAIAIVIATAVLGLFRYFQRMWIIGASRDTEFDLRNDIFARLQGLSPSYYDSQRTGDLMSRATNDLEAVRQAVGPGIMQFFNSALLLPMAAVRMVWISPWLSFCVLLPVVAIPILVNLVGNLIHKRYRAVQDHFAKMSAMLQENLAGVRVVRAFGQQESQAAEFESLNREYVRLNMRLAALQAGQFPIIRMLLSLSVVALLFVGGHEVAQGRLSIGTIIEFSLVLTMLYWPLIALGWTISLMQRGAASMERINSFMEGRGYGTTTPETAQAMEEPTSPVGRSVEVRNLSFRYRPELPLALDNVSFVVQPNRRLGIVGPTGSGKTTLAALLTGLYDAPPGTVFIGGRDVREIPPRDLRHGVALVFQETFLFSDTLSRNIAFAVPQAEDTEIRLAAEDSGLAPDVETFPSGYETILGERGINLSGGQKQRAAIARALLRKPEIMILDDALSAVDTETEARILAALDRRMASCTAIIIAHRISAVLTCDEILVLDEGRVRERGTHEELLAHGGLYKAFFDRQQLADAVSSQTA